jgi:hypothetical protein
MDVCLRLLRQGVEPANLTWIMPRDSLLHDRAQYSLARSSPMPSSPAFIASHQAIVDAISVDDLFEPSPVNGCAAPEPAFAAKISWAMSASGTV